MRCPDCSKFVSMENADPEVNDIEGQADIANVIITASVRGVRNCAECGTELKDCDMDMEDTVDVEQLDGFKKLTEVQQAGLLAALEAGEAEIEVEDNGGEVDEAGGGRYAKNMLTTRILYKLTITFKAVESGNEVTVSIEHEGDLESKNAASEFNECC